MHDLILRRVAGYRPGDLMRFLHGGEDDGATDQPPGPRRAARAPCPARASRGFPRRVAASAAPCGWSLGRGPWPGRLHAARANLAGNFAEIAARGPRSEDFDDPRRARRSGRRQTRESDLQSSSSRPAPDRAALAQPPPLRSAGARPAPCSPSPSRPPRAARWLALLKLRQRRLVRMKRDELRLVTMHSAPSPTPTARRSTACAKMHRFFRDEDRASKIAHA